MAYTWSDYQKDPNLIPASNSREVFGHPAQGYKAPPGFDISPEGYISGSPQALEAAKYAQKGVITPSASEAQAQANAPLPVNSQNQYQQKFNQLGTANQYQQAFNQVKDTPAPQTQGGAAPVITSTTQQNTSSTPKVNEFFQTNPVFGQATQEWGNFNAPTNLQNELLTQMKGIQGQQNQLASLNAEYMNTQNIMGGTEDDIRDEIAKAGGFATDSQVQALTIARNKTLLKKATLLQNQIQLQQDAIQNATGLLNFEREMATTQFNQQMQMAQFAYQIQKDTKNAAIDSLNSIIKTAGYGAVVGDSQTNSKIEGMLGLPSGSLLNLAAIDEKKRAFEETKQNLELQKLGLDVKEKLGKLPSQGSELVSLLGTQNKIESISGLLNNSYLDTAVNPNFMGRTSWTDWATGGKANFLGSLEQLVSQLNLDSLIQAKAAGATFGALSDQELRVLASSASKIGALATKDSTGKITGVKMGVADFKDELDKINNMAKLDFVLKGGDPQVVGLQEIKGHLYAKNWDGSMSLVK